MDTTKIYVPNKTKLFKSYINFRKKNQIRD